MKYKKLSDFIIDLKNQEDINFEFETIDDCEINYLIKIIDKFNEYQDTMKNSNYMISSVNSKKLTEENNELEVILNDLLYKDSIFDTPSFSKLTYLLYNYLIEIRNNINTLDDAYLIYIKKVDYDIIVEISYSSLINSSIIKEFINVLNYTNNNRISIYPKLKKDL